MDPGDYVFVDISCFFGAIFRKILLGGKYFPYFGDIGFLKYEFLRPSYQPTTTIRRKSINGTLVSLSMAICGGLRVPFMKETVRART